MSIQKCLVTGATGFIGSHIAEHLIKKGYTVRCLVRKSSNTSFLKSINVELVFGDLSNINDINKAMEGCDTVFHSAAHVGDWGTIEEIKLINIEGTRNILDCSIQHKINKLIYISTTDVYGYLGTENVNETYPYSKTFKNWYSHTKIEAEKLVFEYYEKYNLPIVAIRPSTVYGPRSYSLVDEIIQGIQTKMMFLVGNKKVIAGLCHIDNLMDLIFLCLKSEKAVGNAYNGCDGSKVTWEKYINALAKLTKSPPVNLVLPYWIVYILGYILEIGYRTLRSLTGLKSRPLLSRLAVNLLGIHQDFSIEKAKLELGFEPKVNFEAGIESLKEYLNQRGYLS